MNYNEEIRTKALTLSDKIGVHVASEQLNIPYSTLYYWRAKRKKVNAGVKVNPQKVEKVKVGKPRKNKVSDVPVGIFCKNENSFNGAIDIVKYILENKCAGQMEMVFRSPSDNSEVVIRVSKSV